MNVVFLPRALRDLEWFRHYYEQVFPQGAAKAQARYAKAFETLERHPFSGRASEDGIREFVIARTPFTVIYRVRDERLEVLRILDGRANQTGDWP